MGIDTIKAAQRADAWWARATTLLLLIVAAMGGGWALLAAPVFSGSAVVGGVVILAVASALVRSRLGALSDLRSEAALHGLPSHPHRAVPAHESAKP